MESNVGSLRRRLNKAVRECKLQASCTVRSLAGQIRTMDRRPGRIRRQETGTTKPKTYSYNLQQAREEEDKAEEDKQTSAMYAAARAEFFCQYVYVLNNQHQEQEQQQQVEKFFSDDDYDHQQNYDSFHREQHTSTSSEPSTDAIVDDLLPDDYQHCQREEAMSFRGDIVVGGGGGGGDDEDKQQNGSGTSNGSRVMKMPINSSLKTNHYFIRSSTSNMSMRHRGSSRRRRRRIGSTTLASLGTPSPSSKVVSIRKVRFQPIPQKIDISIVETNDSTLETSTSNSSNNNSNSNNVKLSGFSKMKKAHFSAKPLIKRLHNLSHIKLNKIKLKGFSSLKQQLNQTLNNASYAPTSRDGEEKTTKEEMKSVKSVDEDVEKDDGHDWGSDFDEESLDSSLANGGNESGMESNHSGSQDSGHSTQHSGYSTHSSCHLTSHHKLHTSLDETNFREEKQTIISNTTTERPPEAMPEEQSSSSLTSSPSEPPLVDSPAAKTSPESAPTELGELEATAAASGEGSDHQQPTAAGFLMEDDDDNKDRRSRFLKNRLIINTKLESIFQRTSSSAALPQVVAQVGAQRKPQPVLACGKLLDPLSGCQGGTLDSAMRSKLLEQQRQMSLKLKQKPRRKSVNRLTSGCQAPSSVESVANNQEEGEEERDKNPSSYVVAGTASKHLHETSERTRDTLTKQLSMICLRQAADQLKLRPHPPQLLCHANLPVGEHHQSSGNLLPGAAYGSTIHIQRSFQPAMSLRQLVKNVIDDCEKSMQPNKLSKSTLDKSSSLSSDLGNSELADELNSPHAS